MQIKWNVYIYVYIFGIQQLVQCFRYTQQLQMFAL